MEAACEPARAAVGPLRVVHAAEETSARSLHVLPQPSLLLKLLQSPLHPPRRPDAEFLCACLRPILRQSPCFDVFLGIQ